LLPRSTHSSPPFTFSLSHSPPIIFFFNAPPPRAIYTLSLHDALPICELATGQEGAKPPAPRASRHAAPCARPHAADRLSPFRKRDRKSTRLNSSHVKNSYAVFCLKKKKKTNTMTFAPLARLRPRA